MDNTKNEYEMPDTISKYAVFKAELDKELNKAADGFVKIGYMLKVARDTDVLAESGYKNVSEFAKAEYGLTPDVVSRYIAINDRYAQDGYSDRLADRYCNYGLAKLAEMLTLPAPLADMIEPDMTRAEIQEIKREYAAEQEITDIEVAIEATDTGAAGIKEPDAADAVAYEPGSILERILYDYYHDNPGDYLTVHADIETSYADIADDIAPAGVRTIITRVAGVGKMMMSIKTPDTPIDIINMRDPSGKTSHGWDEIKSCLIRICAGVPDSEERKAAWEAIYNEPYPKPQQPEPHQIKTQTPAAEDKPKKSKKQTKLAVVTPKQKVAPVQEKAEPEESKSNTDIDNEHQNSETELMTEPETQSKPNNEQTGNTNIYTRLADLIRAFDDIRLLAQEIESLADSAEGIETLDELADFLQDELQYASE